MIWLLRQESVGAQPFYRREDRSDQGICRFERKLGPANIGPLRLSVRRALQSARKHGRIAANLAGSRLGKQTRDRHLMTREELSAAGFPVDLDVHERLARFVERLLDENSRLNLTAIRTAVIAWPLHVCDSLALLPLLRERRAATVVDLGTGGGVPGLPLACAAPDTRFVLIDATRKKIDAVLRIVAALGLPNVEAVWGRAEALAKETLWRGVADVVVARAVAKLPELVSYAGSLVRPGGWAVFMKSVSGLKEEIAAATPHARRASLRFLEMRRYKLPDPHGERAIAIYERGAARR
jgi:16S rRNA (guanine527-N7)-methyltransferase